MLAPAGSPIRSRELADWALSFFSASDRRDALYDSIKSQLGVLHCLGFSTGRAAMTVLLSALRDLSPNSGRDEVVVPGYTCYSVASSVLKAGLKLRVCDIDRRTLGYDPEELASVEFGRVLAIVSANLYGLPNDLPALERVARREGVFLLDDAAQSLDARVGERYSGTFGAAGLLSLDKGKNVTCMQGGLVVTDWDELAEDLRLRQVAMGNTGMAGNWTGYAKILAYAVFLRPSLYWIPGRMPFLSLGETRYEEDYPLGLFSRGLAPIARAQIERLAEITARRIEVATWYREALPEGALVRAVEPVASAEPVYLRFPVRILDPERRGRILRDSVDLGITGSYPRPIADVPEVRGRLSIQNGRFDNALAISREIVTLPTHGFVTRDDVEAIAETIRRALDV